MEKRRPNIVLILGDDLGWADLGCQGSSFYETPRLDRLAGEGLRALQAYAAAPVCSPTRASLMSGKYPARVGITQYIRGHGVGALCDVPYFAQLPSSEWSLAAALRAGGYRTLHVGKWHLGTGFCGPAGHGFEEAVGVADGGQPPASYFPPYRLAPLTDGPPGEYLTDRLTDEAIRLLEQGDGRPFFLNLWHYAVHIPIQSPPALVEKYRAKAARLGLDPRAALVEGEPFAVQHKLGQRVVRRTAQSDPAYAAMVENLDTNVGRLLDALERLGQADNTLVIFTSDNGGLSSAEGSPTCNAPLSEGKGWLEEGGHRVPLLVRWPGFVEPGRLAAGPVTSPDFYPTLLAAAGLPPRPEQHVDGVDLNPWLRGEPFARGTVYWHYPHYSNQGGRPGAAILDDGWKLTEDFETGRLRLFHLPDDLEERRDLADAEPARRNALHARLRAWQAEVGALRPGPNVHWPPPANED